MPTGIRFPVDRPADRDDYADELEEGRSEFVPSTGAARRRNKYRTTPTQFEVRWTFTQQEYTSFDYWVQHTIGGGERAFDIQLLDFDETLVWYTVHGIGPFSYDIVNPEGDIRYSVRWKLRTNLASFEERPSGTDELIGESTPGAVATGALLVYTPFRGLSEIGASGTAKLGVLGMHGESTPGLYALPTGRLYLPIYEREEDGSDARETDSGETRELA